MPRPSTASEVVEAVEAIYAELYKERGAPPTATQVHRRLHRRGEVEKRGLLNFLSAARGEVVSDRKVQQLVREIKDRGGRFHPTEWHPWEDETETSEDAELLLALQGDVFEWWKRGLYRHEARWARRLRAPLSSMGQSLMTMQSRGVVWLVLIALYGHREAVAAILGRPGEPYTSDLDGFLMFAPWSNGWDRYKNAIAAGYIDAPRVVAEIRLESGSKALDGSDALLMHFITQAPTSIERMGGLSVPDISMPGALVTESGNTVALDEYADDASSSGVRLSPHLERSWAEYVFEGKHQEDQDEGLDQTTEQEQLGVDNRSREGQQGAAPAEVLGRQGEEGRR